MLKQYFSNYRTTLKKSTLRLQSGDTLIEVSLALALLSLVLLMAFNTAIAATELGRTASERIVAANIGQEQAEALERYRDAELATPSQPFFTAVAFLSTFYMCRCGTSTWNPTSGTANYDYTGNITPSGGLYTVGIKRSVANAVPPIEYLFTITVSWAGNDANPTNTYVLYTKLADIGQLNPIDCSVSNPSGSGPCEQ